MVGRITIDDIKSQEEIELKKWAKSQQVNPTYKVCCKLDHNGFSILRYHFEHKYAKNELIVRYKRREKTLDLVERLSPNLHSELLFILHGNTDTIEILVNPFHWKTMKY